MESWLPIAGYEGSYEVSDLGRVRSLDRLVPHGARLMRVDGRILKQLVNSRSGYLAVSLCLGGKNHTFTVHRLVANAFLGPRPELLECCHSNGDPLDNRAANLRWDTHQANVDDAVAHGRMRKPACRRGHERTSENTYLWTDPRGYEFRQCLDCRRQVNAAARAA